MTSNDRSETEPRPFHSAVPGTAPGDRCDRLARARWPHEPLAIGRGRGVPLSCLEEPATDWRDGDDWRTHEARLDACPQCTTAIDGQTSHVLPARAPERDATPLIPPIPGDRAPAAATLPASGPARQRWRAAGRAHRLHRQPWRRVRGTPDAAVRSGSIVADVARSAHDLAGAGHEHGFVVRRRRPAALRGSGPATVGG